MIQLNSKSVVLLAVGLSALLVGLFIYYYIQFYTTCIMSNSSSASTHSNEPPRRRLFNRFNFNWLRRNRRRQRDEEEAAVHPPVYCVEDLEVPPPVYQRSRRSPPSDAELRTLREQLETLKHMRMSHFEPLEKTLHAAEIASLDSWIKYLENLMERRAARLAARAAATAKAEAEAEAKAAAEAKARAKARTRAVASSSSNPLSLMTRGPPGRFGRTF
ncbi:hypothetical protein PT974_06493 [Cladobotryum mycophilum]|uniref:Uncharacterized protein n=1 Tax=Cladobotryum mycophilum TaxID=491253 RepID=A0ABR0SMS8_9HYPO